LFLTQLKQKTEAVLLELNVQKFDTKYVDLEALIAQYPSYRWRIWTLRYCAELQGNVLSASCFFLDTPNEYLFTIPSVEDGMLNYLLAELNERAGWDEEIEKWQRARLQTLISILPAPTTASVGHA